MGLVLLFGIGSSTVARAEEPRRLGYDLRVDIPVTAVAAGTAIGLSFASGSLAASCRWCASNGLDDAVRDALRRNDPAAARTASDVLAVSSPFVGIGLLSLASHDEGAIEHAPLDALLVGEATAIAMMLNGISKVAFARERPFVHALPDGEKGATPSPSDNNVSFFSGHAAFTFAIATSAGTIAQMRGYRMAPAIWGVGLPLALATSYLRIAGDKHYFTDVLGGMVVGSAVGVLVPLLFHGPVSERVIVGGVPVQGGQMITVSLPSPF